MKESTCKQEKKTRLTLVEKRIIREKERELIKSIVQTRVELETANKNFETAEDILIDYYSYQIKAYKAKLDYLIRNVKKNGMKLDIITTAHFIES